MGSGAPNTNQGQGTGDQNLLGMGTLGGAAQANPQQQDMMSDFASGNTQGIQEGGQDFMQLLGFPQSNQTPTPQPDPQGITETLQNEPTATQAPQAQPQQTADPFQSLFTLGSGPLSQFQNANQTGQGNTTPQNNLFNMFGGQSGGNSNPFLMRMLMGG